VAWLLVSAVVLVVLVVLAGLVGGVGPLRALGLRTVPLDAVAYRLTTEPTVIQVGVTLPEEGLCRDDEIAVVAFERGNRVEVTSSATRARAGSCVVTSLGGDVRWADVRLTSSLGTRTVIRADDREPLPRESTPAP
jgi:hypothetical protein